MSNTPTDAEIWQMWIQMTRVGVADPVEFARAIIAKWGTPPAVAGEPVAYLHDDGYWTAAKTDVGRSLNDRLLFAGSPKVAVYTTPQATQAQAGAVPLTDEQIKVINTRTLGYLHFARAIEHAHGIGIKDGDGHGLPT